MCVQSCLTLCDSMDYSLPGFSVHGFSQARILEWLAISLFRLSSWLRDPTRVSCIGRQILYCWVPREARLKRLLHLLPSTGPQLSPGWSDWSKRKLEVVYVQPVPLVSLFLNMRKGWIVEGVERLIPLHHDFLLFIAWQEEYWETAAASGKGG